MQRRFKAKLEHENFSAFQWVLKQSNSDSFKTVQKTEAIWGETYTFKKGLWDDTWAYEINLFNVFYNALSNQIKRA